MPLIMGQYLYLQDAISYLYSYEGNTGDYLRDVSGAMFQGVLGDDWVVISNGVLGVDLVGVWLLGVWSAL